MRVLGLALALGCLALPAEAQQARPSNWCGNYLIGSGPNAPRAAVSSAAELGRLLPRQCAAGDVLYLTMLEDNAAPAAAMLCDYTRTITIERARDGASVLTCVWTGGMRGSR